MNFSNTLNSLIIYDGFYLTYKAQVKYENLVIKRDTTQSTTSTVTIFDKDSLIQFKDYIYLLNYPVSGFNIIGMITNLERDESTKKVKLSFKYGADMYTNTRYGKNGAFGWDILKENNGQGYDVIIDATDYREVDFDEEIVEFDKIGRQFLSKSFYLESQTTIDKPCYLRPYRDFGEEIITYNLNIESPFIKNLVVKHGTSIYNAIKFYDIDDKNITETWYLSFDTFGPVVTIDESDLTGVKNEKFKEISFAENPSSERAYLARRELFEQSFEMNFEFEVEITRVKKISSLRFNENFLGRSIKISSKNALYNGIGTTISRYEVNKQNLMKITLGLARNSLTEILKGER